MASPSGPSFWRSPGSSEFVGGRPVLFDRPFRRDPGWLPAALVFALWLYGWGLPALEDDAFWWVPSAQLMVERGPLLVPQGELPSALLPPGIDPPPQWSGTLPDFAHPPLFFWYLAAWLALLGSSMHSVHVALLPLGLLSVLGIQRLAATRLSPALSLATACIAMTFPPVVAQLGRADLDLALLAVTPWALLALVRRRPLRFALLAAVATWIKEPGVLLCAPAAVAVVLFPRGMRGRMALAALSPLLALLTWALVHRGVSGWGLPGFERLAPDTQGVLQDVWRVVRFALLEQGRFILTALALTALLGRRADADRLFVGVLASHLLTQVVFFGTINFLGGDPLRPFGSHWRYLLPALPALSVLGMWGLAQRASHAGRESLLPWLWPGMVVTSVVGWHGSPAGGVERNLSQWDLARAHARVRPALEAALRRQTPVWVGSYAYVQYVSPAVGFPGPEPLLGLAVYGQETDPTRIPPDALVLESSSGEPLGRLSQQLKLEPVLRVEVHHAWVQLWAVRADR